MTTIIYKKWCYLAADRKFTWWVCYHWMHDKIKIIKWLDDSEVYIVKSWTSILEEKIINIFDKIFYIDWILKFREELLYDFQKQIKEIDDRWFNIFVIVKINLWIEKAFNVQNDSIETIDNIACIWTWWQLARWILLYDKDSTPESIFERVSTLDIYTSKEFDIINL